jgi:cytochrome c oxidase subunit 3
VPVETRALERPASRGPIGPARDGAGGPFGRPGDDRAAPETSPLRVGVWLVVGAAVVLFAAFTSTYLARRVQADWRVGPLPSILWVNTVMLLASSVAIEAARRAQDVRRTRAAVGLATLLGVAFLAGQVAAWRQLVAAGVYLASNPHADFFYLLTGAHAVHLVGGVGALAYAWRRVGLAPAAGALVGAVAIYWHFVDALWLYIFAILFWV